jgi:hypothetical protein
MVTATTKTLLRKSYLRGRGACRVRVLVLVNFGATNPGGYTQGFGFCDDGTNFPNNGLDMQAIIPEAVIDSGIACVVEPKMTLLSSWTGFVHGLLGTQGILDFAGISINNYSSPPYKRAFVKLFGIKAGPVLSEATTDASFTAGMLVLEGEYSPISGAEA